MDHGEIEHPEGQREIDELHVPLGRPVKLTMTSEDVIHDFYIPAFRVRKTSCPGGIRLCGLSRLSWGRSTCFARNIVAPSTLE